MGHDYDNQLFSLLRDKSKEGMAIAILGPRRSIQLKNSKTLPYLMTQESGQQTGRDDTTTEQEPPTRDTDERVKGKQSRELNQHMSSWRVLKDRLLSANSCNQSRCPMIKERLEIHHHQIHGRESCPKSSTATTSRSKNCSCKSRLSCNQNICNNKPSQNLSAHNINANKNPDSKSIDQNNAPKSSNENLIRKNESSKKADGFTNYNTNLVIRDDDNDPGACSGSKKYVNKSTTYEIITVIDKTGNKDDNSNCCRNRLNKMKHNDENNNNPSARYIDCCTSPCDFNLINKPKIDASVSCDVPVKENYTTTYSDSYNDKAVDPKQSVFSRKRNFDQIKISNSRVNDSKVTIDYSSSPDKASKMIDKCSSPRKGSKVMIDNCNSVQSIMTIARNYFDINLPCTSKKACSIMQTSNSDKQIYDNNMPCGTKVNNSAPDEKHGNNRRESSDDPEYINSYLTTYKDAYTGHIEIDGPKFPLVPLKRDFCQICKRSNTNFTEKKNIDLNQPDTQNNCKDGPQSSDRPNNESSTINVMQIDTLIPVVKRNSCGVVYCDGPEKPQCTDDFTTTYSIACIGNIDNLELALISRKVNYIQTDPYNSHDLDKKIMIDNSNSVQFVVNIAENIQNDRNQASGSKDCEDDICTIDNPTRTETSRDSSKKLKCADYCTTTYNNAYTGNIEAILQYPIVRREGHVVKISDRKLDKKNVCANQTNNSKPKKILSGDGCTSPGKSECTDNSTTTFSNALMNTFKPVVPCNRNGNQIDVQPDPNTTKNTGTFISECCSTKNSNNNCTKNTNKPVNDAIKSCECFDNTASTKKLKFDKSTSFSNIFSKFSRKNKQLPYCKSPTDSVSLDSHKNISCCSTDVYDISASDSKLLLNNNGTRSKKHNATRCPIFKEVKEWFRGVPVKRTLEKDGKECNNKAINDLVQHLKKLSKEADNPHYDEKVRKEIDACLSKISICYPGDKKEKGGFKQGLAHRLFQRLKQLGKKNVGTTFSGTQVRPPLTSCKLNFSSHILSKDVEIRILITEWLRSLTKNSNMTSSQISQLADFVVIRISPLLNIPVSTYNHKIILKTAIVNVRNDLSIGNINWLQNRDVQIHNYARDLAEKLLSVQAKYGNAYKNKNLSTNKYSELKDCINRRETVICSEIKKCFEDASVEPKDVLVEEVGVILMDCYEIPHPEAERDAKKEIVNILVNSANMTEPQASHLAKNVMRNVRRILNKGEVRKGEERLAFYSLARPCTVLVCTSIEEDSPLTYPINLH